MAIVRSRVILVDDTGQTGKKVGVFEYDAGGGETYHHQGYVLVDPDKALGTPARVLVADPAGGDAGVVVRNIPSGTQAVSGPLTDTQLRASGVPVAGPVTDTQLRASAVPVSLSGGSVSVTNFPGTQPVSGPLTDTQLRANNVGVTGPLTDTQLRASGVPVTGPATDTQLRATPLPVSGTVTANAGTGTFAVSGPLTDTQIRATPLPVSGTFWQATQPISGTVTANAGTGTFAVSGPATDAQLRATPLPVSVPAAVRIGDGTDEATVLPRGTAPTAADKGLCVVALSVARPSYQLCTTEITSATATGVKENLTLWHPSSLAKDVFIVEIGVNIRIMQTAGTFGWELQFISAENGTPGGTPLTPQPLDQSIGASGLTVRLVPTGAPTVAGQIFQRASFPLPAAASPLMASYDGVVLFRAKDLVDYSDAIRLKNAVAEGLRITQNIIATLTVAPVFTIYVRYIERA